MLLEVVREKEIKGAIPSKILIDGAFFCYGLENENYKIPEGVYSAYGMTSPKFGTEKVYLNVDGRSGILFHGGNDKEDTKGCILTGATRTGETISGDRSNDLFSIVDAAYKRGESIAVKVTSDTSSKAAMVLLLAGAVALFFAIKG